MMTIEYRWAKQRRPIIPCYGYVLCFIEIDVDRVLPSLIALEILLSKQICHNLTLICYNLFRHHYQGGHVWYTSIGVYDYRSHLGIAVFLKGAVQSYRVQKECADS